jgi:transcriptional regulator with GAF, ATPase, and Fis domain
MSTRLNLSVEPAFAGLKSVLTERMARLGEEIHADEFARVLDPLLREILACGFAQAGAHEGTVWLVDATGQFLEPAFNNGPFAAQMVGQFRQPLEAGLISMVFATEQAFLENDVTSNAQQSKLLDSKLNVQTSALIAVPLHFLNACRGVVSCVQLNASPGRSLPTSGFHPQHLAGIERCAALVAQLIEYRLLRRTVGWNNE